MKIKCTALLVVLSILMSGCSTGISQEQYESVVAENESLGAELNDSLAKFIILEMENKVLEGQYQELLKKVSIIPSTFGEVSYDIPDNWKLSVYDDTIKLYDNGKGYVIMLNYIETPIVHEGILTEEQEKASLATVKSKLIKDVEELSSEYVLIADNILALKTIYDKSYGEESFKFMAYIFLKSNKPHLMTQAVPEEKEFDSSFIDIVNSVK